MRRIVIIGTILLIGAISTWYFDFLNEPVETIDELVGHNYDYANKMYFESAPDKYYTININNNLNEFDGGILNRKDILTDSIVYVYTWEFVNHKETIWVGKTEKLKSQIIDAIRYKNSVKF